MLTLVLLALTQAQAQAGPETEQGFGIEPRVAIWLPNLSGRFRADEGRFFGPMIDGTTVSLDDDLRMRDSEGFGYYELGFTEVFADGGRHATFERATLSFWAHEWTGDTTLDSEQIFNGATFNAGDRVDSKFRIWSLGLDGSPMTEAFDNGRMTAAFTIGMRVIEVKASLSAPGRDTGERTRLVYLGGGLRTEWKPSEHTFAGIAAGVYLSFGTADDDWEWTFQDWLAVAADGAASIGIDIYHLRAEIGLRFAAGSFDIEREDEVALEDNRFSYFLGGPFVQLSIRW